MKKLLASFGCALMLYVANGQDQKLHRSYIGILVGREQMKFLDRHASPLIYTGTASPYYGFSYHKQTRRTIFDLKLSGGYGTANPKRFGARDYQVKWSDSTGFQYQVSSEFFRANLEATYLVKLGAPSLKKMNLWLGATINESLFYADEIANNPWATNLLDVAPALLFNYLPGKRHAFTIQTNFAVFGLNTRLPYRLFAKSNKDKNVPAYFKQGTRAKSLNKYQKVDLDLGYTFYASNRIAIGAGQSFKWFRDTDPLPLSAIESTTNINLKYLFR